MNRCVLTTMAVVILLSDGRSSGIGSITQAADLKDSLKPLIEAHAGDVAVCIRHLETGEQFAWREDEVQPTASLIKMPVMVAAYRMVDRKELERLPLRRCRGVHVGSDAIRSAHAPVVAGRDERARSQPPRASRPLRA